MQMSGAKKKKSIANYTGKLSLEIIQLCGLLWVSREEIESLNKNMLKNQLSGEFEMKDLSVAQKILGMEIHRDLARYFLSQMNYVEKVLEDFRMQWSKPVSTPLVTHFKNFQKLCQHSLRKKRSTSHVPYSSVVGSMMYAMVCTYSNISRAHG